MVPPAVVVAPVAVVGGTVAGTLAGTVAGTVARPRSVAGSFDGGVLYARASSQSITGP